MCMMTFKRVLCLLMCLFLCVGVNGCATIISGSQQDINIASTPEDVKFTIEQLAITGPIPFSEGKTPHVASLCRKNSYLLTLSKTGYESAEIPIEYGRMNGWAWVNFITFPLGTLIGLMIDSSTGAAVILEPDEVNANLLKQ